MGSTKLTKPMLPGKEQTDYTEFSECMERWPTAGVTRGLVRFTVVLTTQSFAIWKRVLFDRILLF